MHRRTAKGNRIGLAVTGLVLLAGGAALAAGWRGLYGAASTTQPLYRLFDMTRGEARRDMTFSLA